MDGCGHKPFFFGLFGGQIQTFYLAAILILSFFWSSDSGGFCLFGTTTTKALVLVTNSAVTWSRRPESGMAKLRLSVVVCLGESFSPEMVRTRASTLSSTSRSERANSGRVACRGLR